MRESRGEKDSPRQNYVNHPDDQTGDSPDDRYPHQLPLVEKETYGHQQVADIAHPKHMCEFVDPPVVNALGQEEDEWQNSEEW